MFLRELGFKPSPGLKSEMIIWVMEKSSRNGLLAPRQLQFYRLFLHLFISGVFVSGLRGLAVRGSPP